MDKQTVRNSTFSPLPTHQVIALHGRDAAAFAQAQYMSDVNTATPGLWQWSGWLTSKGRVIALFALLRLDAETIWLLVHDADADALALAMRRFVFRSKVQITVLDDVHACGAFDRPALATGNRLHVDEGGIVELDMSGGGGPRCLLLLRSPAPDGTEDRGRLASAFLARWISFDLAHGLPWLTQAPVEQWTPQQLSLQRLRAYSVAKGCYPGQEIVARTHFLGQAKRGLVRLQAMSPVAVGSEVIVDGGAVGSIVSTATDDSGRHELLAVLPVSVADDARLLTADLPLTRLPLLDGLAR